MGIIVKIVGHAPMITDGYQITYAENGNVLEILNEDEEIIGAFRHWEYAIAQEPDEGYQFSQVLDDEEEDDEDLADDEGDGEDVAEPNGSGPSEAVTALIKAMAKDDEAPASEEAPTN